MLRRIALIALPAALALAPQPAAASDSASPVGASVPDTAGAAAASGDSLDARLMPAARTPASSRADSAAPARATQAPAASILSEPRPIDDLWVLRGALVSPASIDSVVTRARAMNVRALLAQVVGRGDAFFRSDLLPRSEALWAHRDWDPLGALIERAHGAGLEVHAWMNCMLVWSAESPPRDPRHVLHLHPEWVSGLRDGRRMTSMSAAERKQRAVEGVFLSPGHPRVREWVASIAAEIARRYPVDGVHLDYIRQPALDVGYDPTTRARFAMETGVDPERFDLVEPARRASVDSSWRAFQRAQVTAVVQAVRDSLAAARPGAVLSAAVIADTIQAERHDAQAWRAWARDGLVDRVFLMSYAPSVQTVMDQLVAAGSRLGVERVVPGIAVFNTSTATAATKIKGARALGFPRVALYSYDSLWEKPGAWTSLRERIAATPILETWRSP